MSKKSMQELRKMALVAVETDPTHHLRLGMRQAIWAEFGPRAESGRILTRSHLQRISLAVAGVLHVLPIWKHQFGKNQIPTDALSTVRSIVRRKLTVAHAQRVFDGLWNDVLHLAGDQPVAEVAVGFAAVQMLSTAMYDEFFDAVNPDLNRPDEDDPENHDAAYYSATAQAGGLPWDESSSSERRLKFWRWWLEEGIDAAQDTEFLRKL